MSESKMREEFEAAFIAEQVLRFGDNYRDCAVHMLKRGGDFDRPPSHYELSRRELGLYDDYWVEMVWWAWKGAREAAATPERLSVGELDELEAAEVLLAQQGFSNLAGSIAAAHSFISEVQAVKVSQ